jgi:hypothetical protein
MSENERAPSTAEDEASWLASPVPVGLDELLPADKSKAYEMMHLRVFAHPDDTFIAGWGCNASPLPPGSCRTPDR